mmetsp:Transcript_2723/g.3745  ORF Transcript_2723/g.3745 Transcript_2723/m.3745 type:complete len:98 (+) Transcript_2723:73-366(+)
MVSSRLSVISPQTDSSQNTFFPTNASILQSVLLRGQLRQSTTVLLACRANGGHPIHPFSFTAADDPKRLARMMNLERVRVLVAAILAGEPVDKLETV